MPFSLSIAGNKDQVVGGLIKAFNESDHVATPGVLEFVSVAEIASKKFADVSHDAGKYSVIVSGHVKQQPDERDFLVISIAATD